MAKGEAKKTNTALDAARTQTTGFQSNFNNTMQTRGDDAYARNLAERNTLTSGYGDFARTGGMTPEQEARLRAAGAGGGGGYTAPSYSLQGNSGDELASYGSLMNGGGVNRYALPRLQEMSNARGGIADENYNAIQQGLSGYKNIADTGGYSADARSRIQGNINDLSGTRQLDAGMMGRFNEGLGGYSEFARTGGIDDQQRADIMARGQSIIPSFYGSMQQQLQNSNRVQGGYNPGAAASARNLARDGASQAQAAARDTRLGLQEQINSGRLQGMQGLTTAGLSGAQAMNDADYRGLTSQISADQGFQQAQIGNQLEGLGGYTQGNLGLAGQISQNQLGASNALNDLTGIDLQAKLAGTAGSFGIKSAYANEAQQNAAAQSAASSAAAANNLALEKYILSTQNENKLAGLGGLGNVYNSAPAETGMYYDNQLQNQSITGNQVQNNLNTRAQYNPNQSGWDKVMNGLQVGTGIAGAALGGFGGFGSNAPAPTGGTGGFNINNPVTATNWTQPNFQNPTNTNPWGGFGNYNFG